MLESLKDWTEQDVPPIILLLILIFRDSLTSFLKAKTKPNGGKDGEGKSSS